MKKIKFKGKLNLNKQTIAKLNNQQMGSIFGGSAIDPVCYYTETCTSWDDGLECGVSDDAACHYTRANQHSCVHFCMETDTCNTDIPSANMRCITFGPACPPPQTGTAGGHICC